MSLIKVLGIGSPFGDDQLGWNVAESLKQYFSTKSEFSKSLVIESHDRPGVRLIEFMEGAKTVFIIDALKSGSAIGTIHRLENTHIFTLETNLSTHNIGLVQALQLAQALNAMPANLVLYGVEISALELESRLSPAIEKAIGMVVLQIISELVNMGINR